MKYVGSKSKIAKHLVPIIQKYIDTNKIETYIEPFVGGANVIDKIKCERRLGADIDPLVINLFHSTIKDENLLNTLPETLTKEHYYDVRDVYWNEEGFLKYPEWYRSAILLFGSYNARVYGGCFGGFAKTKDGKIRNYFQEAKRNYEKQLPNLKGISFIQASYDDVLISDMAILNKNVLIYCDIPYKDSIGYKSNFNHDEFWEWVRIYSDDAIILVSEYEAPSDFECIWEMEVKTHMNNRGKLNKTEKLFIYKGV